MKRMLLLSFAFLLCLAVSAQETSTYETNAKTAGDAIKAAAFKQGYQYMITYENAKDGSIFVKSKTDYLIFFVYNNTGNPLADFKGYLMTPDNELKKKYTAKPDAIGTIGAASVKRLKFTTPRFAEGVEQRPVKLEANPPATIYVFSR